MTEQEPVEQDPSLPGDDFPESESSGESVANPRSRFFSPVQLIAGVLILAVAGGGVWYILKERGLFQIWNKHKPNDHEFPDHDPKDIATIRQNMRDFVAQQEKFIQRLEEVQDKQSAQTAAPKMMEIMESFDEIAQRMKTGPKVPQAVEDRIVEQENFAAKNVPERLRQATSAALKNSQREPSLVKAIMAYRNFVSRRPWRKN
ncbi:MAG: hypothetical protein Tsb009_35680 [Planctomycetaceae bacterium]